MQPGPRNFACAIAFFIATTTAVPGADLTVTSFAPYAGQTNIVLQATGNVVFTGGALNLQDLPSGTGLLSVQAGNDVIIQSGTSVSVGHGWSISFLTGANSSAPGNVYPGTGNVTLQGTATLASMDGSISFLAGNGVTVGSGFVDTAGGGSVNVVAVSGSVNTGTGVNGFTFRNNLMPPYLVSPNLGGISTAGGGNLTIAAGGNVTSFVPNSGQGAAAEADAGAGAFGPEPGNVSITAGGNVFGHYVLANGAGLIMAGGNVGADTGNPFALSLIKGAWSINATNGNIYLQEVRNPNGVFNNLGNSQTSHSYHSFDYDPQAAVDLNAVGVYLTGVNIPRPDGLVQILYPSSLNITAGSGDVVFENSATLFPSPFGNLNITTANGGSLMSTMNVPGVIPELLMSDSSQTQWHNSTSFADTDHGAVPAELNNANAVVLNISGSMENLNLVASMQTEITIGGDMDGCGFSGQNLHPTDVTFINVAGQIFNPSAYAFVFLTQPIPAISAPDLPPGVTSSWDQIFNLALDPVRLASFTVPPGTPPTLLDGYAFQNAGAFTTLANSVNANPGFVYNPATEQLGFAGPMSQQILQELTQPLIVLQYGPDGFPIVDSGGHFVTDAAAWVATPSLQTLFQESQTSAPFGSGQLGYRIGGPGAFDIAAGSISLGNTYGILSCGVTDPQGGFNRYANLASLTPSGATVNVTVTNNLDMETSTIAAIGGGNVNVTSTGGMMNIGSPDLPASMRQLGSGIFTSGPGDVNVTALGDIDISGSRIAAYNGGNIFVESLEGNVNAGSGGNAIAGVLVSYVNPVTGQADFYTEQVTGDGIVAATLVNPGSVPGSASVPGNITVLTPEGDISTDGGGILQEALNGNTAAGPTVTLAAGSPGFNGSPGYPGNINLGGSGVIGETVNLIANGNITGLVVSSEGNVSGAVSVTGQSPQFYVTAVAGTNVQFNASAIGTSPVSCQWFKNATNLPGETNAFLSLTDIGRADAANYSIVVSNTVAVITNAFQLHVLVPQLLSSSFVQTNQTLSISFGDAGGGTLMAQDIASFVIQTSSNLVDWTPVYPPVSTNADGGLSFQVPISSNPGGGFYRVLSQ